MASSPPRREVVDVGTVIAETYVIEGLLGEGGMGSVWLASHKRLPGKRVAIKMLHADVSNEEIFARFRHEAEIASRLGHPNIVTVHDFNVTPGGIPYLILEYLQGESLGARIAAGPMPLDQVMSIARQIGSALSAAHREGIVHRDLKPGNIFIVPTEVDGRLVDIVKVLDFGISKMRDSKTVKTLESTLLGTPQYMAPEQAKGDHKTVDERTDIFALGAIVYEMLSGTAAFAGNNIPEVVFKVVYEQPTPLASLAPMAPNRVIDAVNQAMAKPAVERFPSVSGFVEALTGEPLSQYTPAAAATTTGPTSRVRQTGREAYDHTMNSLDQALPQRLPGEKSGSTVSLRTPTLETESGKVPKVDPAEVDLPRASGTQAGRAPAPHPLAVGSASGAVPVPSTPPADPATRLGRRSSAPPLADDAASGASTAASPPITPAPIAPATRVGRKSDAPPVAEATRVGRRSSAPPYAEGSPASVATTTPAVPVSSPPSVATTTPVAPISSVSSPPVASPPVASPPVATSTPSIVVPPSVPTTMPPSSPPRATPPEPRARSPQIGAPPERRGVSPVVLIGAVGAAVVIAVLVMYIVMTRSSDKQVATNPPTQPASADAATPAASPDAAMPATDAAVAAAQDAAVVATQDAAVVAAHDAAVVAIADAAVVKPAIVDAPPRQPTADAAGPSATDDPASEQALTAARAALDGNDLNTANLRSQQVINSPNSSPRQKAFALAIAGILECIHDDIGAAHVWQRQIPAGFGAARAQLRAGCRAHGHPEFE